MKRLLSIFVAFVLAAIGLAQVPNAPGLTRTQGFNLFNKETKAQKIRRLLARADLSNPFINQPLAGSSAWQPSTAYVVGQVVSNQRGTYTCTAAGTSASSGGPTGRATGQTDSSVTWDYVGPQTAPTLTALTADPAYLPTITRARQVMATYTDMEELIRLGAYRAGTSAEVDDAIRLHKPLEDFLAQTKEDATSLADGYRRLDEILADSETER